VDDVPVDSETRVMTSSNSRSISLVFQRCLQEYDVVHRSMDSNMFASVCIPRREVGVSVSMYL
jgi:hypothetical protein